MAAALVRRSVIGFGARDIYDQPLTLCSIAARAYVIDRVIVVGDGAATALRVDGRTVPANAWNGVAMQRLEERHETVRPGQRIEIDVLPTSPTQRPPIAPPARMKRSRLGRWVLAKLGYPVRTANVALKVFIQ